MNRRQISLSLLAILGIATPGRAAPPPAIGGQIVEGRPLLQPRAGHTATLLPSGEVLIAGGCTLNGCDEGLTRSTELFSPLSGAFRRGPDLPEARVGHVALRLADGRVLLIGGWTNDGASARVDAYDAATGKFTLLGRLLEGRDGFTATLLPGERVLIVGGYRGAIQRLASAEVFDVALGRSNRVADLSSPRMSHTATLLRNGQVLITGGSRARGEILGTAEVFDPASGRFGAVGQMVSARHKHAAARLPGGQVLLLGGANADDLNGQLSSTEVYDPATRRFRAASEMREARYKFADAVARTGQVLLVAGSGFRAEHYDEATNTFRPIASKPLGAKLSYSTATTLNDGRVLILGGYDQQIQIQNRAWLYLPSVAK